MHITPFLRRAGLLNAIGFAFLLSACGGGSGNDAIAAQGTMQVAFTNTGATACNNYTQVNVTVATIGINTSATAPANINEGSWKRFALDTPKRVDLLPLVNGTTESVATMSVPAGHYSQVAVRLEQNLIWGKPASVVSPSYPDGMPLDTGTATTSGIIRTREFDVPANGQVNVLLAFDACNSVSDTGNGSLVLTPVVTVSATPHS